MKINFWNEAEIATSRVVSRLLNDLGPGISCELKLLSEMKWKDLNSSVNIFSRVCHPHHSWIPAFLKKNKIPYIYYLDDNFWCIKGESELARFYQSTSVVNTLDDYIRNAEFVIVHTPAILHYINKRFPRVYCELLPTPFDLSLTNSDEISFERRESSDFVVGYAGGHREEEFKIIEKVVSRLLTERPEIQFEFIGGIPESLRGLDNVQWFPGFSDYSRFIDFKLSRNWDLGLAPLLDSPFNASKTNNKFREYAGCGIVGLYSNVSPYKDCVVQGETGYLVINDVDAWTEAIIFASENPTQRQKISKSARAFIEANHDHRSISSNWLRAIERIPAMKSEKDMSRTQAMRFNYIKFHHQTHSPQLALQAELSSPLNLYTRRLNELLKYLFAMAKPKRSITIIATILALLTLINLNIYLIREALS